MIILFGLMKKRMLTTGDKKIEVSPDSEKHILTFAQDSVMAYVVKKLLDEEMEKDVLEVMNDATLSNVGRCKNKQKFWTGQEDSDNAREAVELLGGIPREEFSVTSKPKGIISGPREITGWWRYYRLQLEKQSYISTLSQPTWGMSK